MTEKVVFIEYQQACHAEALEMSGTRVFEIICRFINTYSTMVEISLDSTSTSSVHGARDDERDTSR
jgi:hypothetical protein